LASEFIDPRALEFLLYDWLNAEALTRQPAYAEHSRETFDAMLDLARRMAADRFATHYKKADRVEPYIEDGQVHVLPEVAEAVRAYAEAGLSAAAFAPEHGGIGLPHLLEAAAMAHFMAANVATAAYPMLTAGNARLLVRFGTPAQIETFALPEITGRWTGTMCLSEPQAGSSLGDIATRAVLDTDDDPLGPRYRLSGNKMWISGGDHDITPNIVHLVLAKVPGPDGSLPQGTAGISLFIVPKVLQDGARNDIAVPGLNHKMGYRGTSNCLLNFGELGGAIGWRVGAAGQGLAIMFHMMNEARIFIGLGAAALACRGYRQSLDYARERRQGRAPGGKNAAAQAPIIEHADVRRMLLAQKAFADGALALVLYSARLIDQERLGDADAAALLGLLTPVAKSWPSEFGLAANDLAIQIHGGYGYTRDFDVEQIYRDNRLNPIHEGTHGIQAADLLGRKILRDKGAALDLLGLRIAATIDRTASASPPPNPPPSRGRASEASNHIPPPRWGRLGGGDGTDLSGTGSNPDFAVIAAQLAEAWSNLRRVVDALIASSEPARTLDNASLFLSAFGHVVVAWLWLDQALALRNADRHAPAFAEGKLRACQYFFEVELPKADAWLAPVAAFSAIASTMPEDAF